MPASDSTPPLAGTRPANLTRPDGATIAYHRLAGRLPGIVFLGGFRSDMTGTKALYLEEYCRERGRAYVRFDYFGHGASSGDFALGTIGRWRDDAVAVVDSLTDGKQILVGSSMSGWIMLLVALARPERIAALVGIAGAPDFTEELLWPRLTPAQRREIGERGQVMLSSDYDSAGYLYTRALIEDGRKHLLLGKPIPLDMPVRLLHGMRDEFGAVAAQPPPCGPSLKPRCRRHTAQGRRSPPLDPGRSRPAGADPRRVTRSRPRLVAATGVAADLAAEYPERESPIGEHDRQDDRRTDSDEDQGTGHRKAMFGQLNQRSPICGNSIGVQMLTSAISPSAAGIARRAVRLA